ncbi:MAG: sensor domain-containing diguanylate cyclase, partial [Nitrospirota bacterium]
KELETLKNSALNLEASTEISLFDEDRFSHLVKTVFEIQKELDGMLNLSKKSVNADSVTLFILEDGDFIPKSSTEDIHSDSIYAVKGYLPGVIREKKPFIIPTFKGSLGIESIRLLNLGQRASKNTRLAAKRAGSSLCVPVFDGNIPIGVLAMAGKSETAFGEREKDIAVSFADQIVQILSKKRIQIEIERVVKGLRALHEANLSLGTSLKVEEIAEKLVAHVFGMVPSSAVGFFAADKGKLRVIAKKGFEPEKESFYPKNTLFDFIIKNKHPLHLSDVDKQQAVSPFRINDTRTFLGIPIISENEVIGIFAVTSKEPNALSSFHGQFLEMLADQAAMAITNAKLHKEVGRLAMTDGLTGLFNHKHFQEMLLMEFQRTERMPQTLSLMLIDIDHFKKINDSYGHPAGDMVLASLAAILRKTLRGIDILARYGGEEFAAVLINTGAGGAKKMAERLREYVMNNPFFIEENKLLITLSIGIAIYPHDAGAKDELIEKADQALYYAKNNGRNQVCLWKDMN